MESDTNQRQQANLRVIAEMVIEQGKRISASGIGPEAEMRQDTGERESHGADSSSSGLPLPENPAMAV
ncbi:MAG: hypothetical protein LBV45_10905 [Xanthomonadaceae bacterium]|nr:hypothetical protein [Xanthomonadaceae bacterium]